MDSRETNSLLSGWKQQKGVNVSLAAGKSSILRDYSVTYTTTRYLIGTDGIIISKATGAQTASSWTNLFNSLIAA